MTERPSDLKLFVGNIPFSIDSSQLAAIFESAENVQLVEVIYDKTTRRSRGFGFVTMSEVKSVARQLNGYSELPPGVEFALLQQVLSLTPEKLSSLSPEQQQEVIKLQQMLR